MAMWLPKARRLVSATSRILARVSAGAGLEEEATLSQILDFVGSAAQGDILIRGASTWTRLPAGTSGLRLMTGGASANPSWASGKPTIQSFSANGTYTPTAGMTWCEVWAQGGGGGGGSAAATTNSFAAGGGSGEAIMKILTAAQIGASKAVAIGAAGTGATSGSNAGGNGGDTTLGTTLAVAKGGTGGNGASGAGAAGGAGGTGGTFDIDYPGRAGSNSLAGSFAGAGADSLFGGGGGISASFGGSAASGNGGGGGGGQNTASAQKSGGNGSIGIMYIIEHFD